MPVGGFPWFKKKKKKLNKEKKQINALDVVCVNGWEKNHKFKLTGNISLFFYESEFLLLKHF